MSLIGVMHCNRVEKGFVCLLYVFHALWIASRVTTENSQISFSLGLHSSWMTMFDLAAAAANSGSLLRNS